MKLQTNRRWSLNTGTGVCQLACLSVDREGDYRVRALIRREQIAACRVDREVSRCLASGRYDLDELHLAGAFIERKHRNTVVSAVRRIDVIAAWRDVQISTTVARPRYTCR